MYIRLPTDNNIARAVAVGLDFVKCLIPVSQFGEGPGTVIPTSQKVVFLRISSVSTLWWKDCVCTSNNIGWLITTLRAVGMDFVKCLSTVSRCV